MTGLEGGFLTRKTTKENHLQHSSFLVVEAREGRPRLPRPAGGPLAVGEIVVGRPRSDFRIRGPPKPPGAEA